MIRPAHAVVFAAVLLKPLGALSADFVVWWEEGLHPKEDAAVAEVVAAFEQVWERATPHDEYKV